MASILEGLGGHFGTKMAPRWSKNGFKNQSTKTITFWMALRSNFVGFWLPSWCPRGVTDLYIFDHFWLLGPSWPQDPPRPLQEASWDRFWTILASNLVDFGIQLGGFWIDFTQKGRSVRTQKTCDCFASRVSHRVPCDARAIRLSGPLLAFQTLQSICARRMQILLWVNCVPSFSSGC